MRVVGELIVSPRQVNILDVSVYLSKSSHSKLIHYLQKIERIFIESNIRFCLAKTNESSPVISKTKVRALLPISFLLIFIKIWLYCTIKI